MEMETSHSSHKKSCSVPNCGLKDQKLFQLPKNEPLRSEWMRLCHVSTSTKRCINVCARHFKPGDFSSKSVQRARLTRRAKPSLYLPLQAASPRERRRCLLPGCQKGRKDGVTLHVFPRLEERCIQWQRLCNLDKTPTRGMIICSRHFLPSDFHWKGDIQVLKKSATPSQHLEDGKTKVNPREFVYVDMVEVTPELSTVNLREHADPLEVTPELSTVNLREHADPLEVNPKLSPLGSFTDDTYECSALMDNSSHELHKSECSTDIDDTSRELELPESPSDRRHPVGCDETPVSVSSCGSQDDASEPVSNGNHCNVWVAIKCDPDEVTENKIDTTEHKIDITEHKIEVTENKTDQGDVTSENNVSDVPLKSQSYDNERTVNAERSKDDNIMASLIASHFSHIHGKTMSEDCECLASQGQSKTDFPSVKGDTGTQAGHHHFTILDLIRDDVQLKAFLGVSSATLQRLTELVLEQISKANFNHKEPFMKQKIALTLCRLRLKLSFECLATLFSIDRWLCSQYFSSTVRLLALVLQGVVYWPSREEIWHNLPRCFLKFHDTRVVLGCTQISVKVPNCFKCRRRLFTFSHYKDAQAVKIMVGVAPSGLIIFLSKVCGGKVSDSHIFKESDLITKSMLEPRKDAVMVDKDFPIDDICKEKLIKIYRPPFVRRERRRLDLQNVDVTLAKVHVEMAIQRLKSFKILTGNLTLSEIPYLDDVFTVIAGIVNLNLLE